MPPPHPVLPQQRLSDGMAHQCAKEGVTPFRNAWVCVGGLKWTRDILGVISKISTESCINSEINK